MGLTEGLTRGSQSLWPHKIHGTCFEAIGMAASIHAAFLGDVPRQSWGYGRATPRQVGRRPSSFATSKPRPVEPPWLDLTWLGSRRNGAEPARGSLTSGADTARGNWGCKPYVQQSDKLLWLLVMPAESLGGRRSRSGRSADALAARRIFFHCSGCSVARIVLSDMCCGRTWRYSMDPCRSSAAARMRCWALKYAGTWPNPGRSIQLWSVSAEPLIPQALWACMTAEGAPYMLSSCVSRPTSSGFRSEGTCLTIFSVWSDLLNLPPRPPPPNDDGTGMLMAPFGGSRRSPGGIGV